ncbi:BTAD domain-containing putative transcriptional regulator [Streptomyces sp. BI20]|uniref:BTAD domain-containing putative transcriptional regulator n=1 Tax=Streptomyces sp. BI20 TaxID=3403460 RepID=UPI003C7275F5
MRFGVLGPLEVWTDQGRQVRVPELKVRVLLAILLAHRSRTVPTARLIEELWGGSASTAQPVSSLQAKVSQLRRALDGAEPGARSLVVHRAPGYLLDVPAGALDLEDFREPARRARTLRDAGERAGLFAKALAVWRGPAFADLADRPFALAAAEGLEEERLTVVEEYAAARLELGEHGLLLGELAPYLEGHPLREGLRAAQMRALYRAGRGVEALEVYGDLRRRLDEELGLTPGPELGALHRAVLVHDPDLSRPAPAPAPAPGGPARTRGNLAAPAGALVGRSAAVAAVRELLARSCLSTLTGPGGVGKTRLALAAAAGREEEFPDGVWLAELAGSEAPEGPAGVRVLADLVLDLIGVRDGDGDEGARDPVRRLAALLAPRRLLLVLDNCEHVLDAAAGLLTVLLEAAPGLHVLATSQEPLRLRRETVWPVPPLALPDPGECDPRAVGASAAVRLFTERARASDPGFALDEETAPLVVELCRSLDGLPLALELAATRVRGLGVRALAERLDDRFRLLTGGYRDAPRRHRTLQATIAWSWGLLEPAEEAVLRRLTVFVDGCDPEAAEAVCAGGEVDGGEVLDVLAALVDRSLVLRVEAPAGVRYRLLESIAAYGRRELLASGEAAETAARHLRHHLASAEAARPHLYGRDQCRRLALLDADAANLQRAAEEAHRSGRARDAVRLANALGWYRFLRGRLRQAERAFAEALALPGEVPTIEVAEARAWHAGFRLLVGERLPEGVCAGSDGTPASGPAAAGRGGPDTVPHPNLARAEWFLAFARYRVGSIADAEAGVRRALRDFRVLRDPWGTAAALAARAALALGRGDLVMLRGNALEAHARFTELGDSWGRLKAAESLAALAEIGGDYDEATRLHGEGLRIAERLELWSEASRTIAGLGRLALLSGRFEEARELHARALRLAEEQGNRPAEQFAAIGLALGLRREGRLAEARRALSPWLEWNRSRADHPGLALVLAELGFIAEQREDARSALALHREGLAAARVHDDPRAVALALEGIAGALSLSGDPAAARLLGTAAAARAAAGAPHPAAERGDVERITGRLLDRLGPAGFAREFERGRLRDPFARAVAEDAGPR